MVYSTLQWNVDRQTVQRALAATRYSCTDLVPLVGGVTNFTYRGTLASPLPDGTCTVTIKHAESISRQEFTLDARRSYYEHRLLAEGIPSFSQTIDGGSIVIRTPVSLHYFPDDHIQVIEHIPQTVNLKTFLYDTSVSELSAIQLGTALGKWTMRFHSWGLHPNQAGLRKALRENREAHTLKSTIYYGRLDSTVDKFPTLLADQRILFQKVRIWMKEVAEQDKNGIIHGDFWPGNILLSPSSWTGQAYPVDGASRANEADQTHEMRSVFVLDWELCHVSSSVFDLGQMFAELYLLHHFRGSQAISPILGSFLAAYGDIVAQDRFNIMLHCGTHLVVWPWRVSGWGTNEQIERCILFGSEVIRNAYKRNAQWFKAGIFSTLFSAID